MRLVVYHGGCFDGICAAWVLSTVYKEDTTFHPMNYGEKFPWDVPTDTDVIFVDFSLPRAELDEIKAKYKSLLVIDHHKTAQAALEGADYAVFDMNESGASLAWLHYADHDSPSYPAEMPALVRYIKDRDLWLFKEPHSEAVNSFIQSYPMDIDTYRMLYQLLERSEGIRAARTGGESILRYQATMVDFMLKQTQWAVIDGHVVPCVNATLLFSEVGNALCRRYPSYSFGAYYFDRADGSIQFGLRSIGSFDVSEVAKGYGGGGHKNAAGFQFADSSQCDIKFYRDVEVADKSSEG